jgi:hypothetical protein
MKRRPYRETQSIEERLSDEFHRRDGRVKDAARRQAGGEAAGTDATHGGAEPQQRARDLADAAIDDMSDKSADRSDRADRKRRLLDGPNEFRSERVDRAKR